MRKIFGSSKTFFDVIIVFQKVIIMLDNDLLLKILKKTLSCGGEYADVFVENRKPVSIQLEDNKIDKIFSGQDSGAGIRLILKGKTYYAYTNEMSEKTLMELAQSLINVSTISGKDISIDLRKQKPDIKFKIKLLPEDVPAAKKIELVRLANKTARNFDKRIRQVITVYRDIVQKVQIAHLYGSSKDAFIAEDERIYTTVFVNVIASDNGIVQTGYEPAGGLIGFELFEKVNIEELALTAAKRAIRMLTSKRASGGRMPVVISSEAGGTMIHEAIGHGLEADLAQQGLSVYSDKLGNHVASTFITVIDDSTLPNKRGSFRFDDEGSQSQSTVLVKEGVLVNYMHDRLTAMHDKTVSTGNGRRESYHNRPIPRMTNTFIAPGKSDPEDILKSTSKGLLVKKMGGGQVNTVNGDFVFDVQEGYVIENGMIGEPVRGATLTGNGPEILKSIDMVGTDLGFSIGTCGKDNQGVPVGDAMPTLRIPEIVVGGEV
ncbi:MAG: TldD/PmbA family protein [Nitrospiraceae bacterium]|nr:TldD/PmbA family protein [Nitrospiraceae bacterium]